MSKDNVTRRISIFVNGKEVENSLKGVDGQILHVRNSLRRLVEGTEDYDKKKAELTETLGKLQQRQSEYREELGLTKKAIEVNENSLQGYQNQLREVQNQMNLLDTTSEDFLKNLNELKKKEEELSQKIKDTTTAIKGQEVVFKASENSLQGVEESLRDVTKQMSLLDLSTKEGKEELQKLKITEAELIEKQKQFKAEISQTNVEMQEANEISGGLRGTLTGIWDSLVSGDLQGAKEGISSLTSGMGGLVKSSLAFIATPFGAALVGGAAFIAGAKALFDFNSKLNEMNTELRALGVNASEISKVRDEISATAETFDKDFKEIAEKANSLSKTYGISMSEANQIIAEGLASGGAQNAEFLDSLGEYDEFFAKAGFSAKEFADVINTGYDLGIYQDKLPDALKEADLSLKENTKSTRDALVNAFGASFSDDILNKVKTGELTTKQALEAIAQKAQESNLSQQQYAQLTADVFKGAGEDAGGAQKIFEALGQSAKRELDATAKASLQLVDANERLNKAQAELFEIDGFGDAWTKLKRLQ
ncbi:MAG: phage tail tape measure protein [Flavobacterium sp.]|nr:phage tail tape measure protein [Flavobacterium sp.]